MRVMNTTAGPVEYDRSRPGHTVNTSDILEPPKMEYTDEEPEILTVVPATGWCAVVGEKLVALIAFVAMDDGKLYGVAVGEDGRIDLTNSAELHPGFTGYKLATNEPKEITHG